MKKHLKKYLGYYLSTIIVIVAFLCVMAAGGVYPFGENTLAHYDGAGQIVPTMRHINDAIYNNASLGFSFNLGGGHNFIGDIFYQAMSPFTLIYILFGFGNEFVAYGVVLILKLVLITILAVFIIRTFYPNTSWWVQTLLALTYTFSAYTINCNTYQPWLDYLLYVPLLALGVKNILDRNKSLLFTLTLTFMIYCNFIITLENMIVLYLTLGLFVFMYVEKDSRKRVSSKIIISTLISLLLASPIIIIGVKLLFSGGRASGNITLFSVNSHISTSVSILSLALPLIIPSMYILYLDRKNSKYSKFLFFAMFLNLVITLLPVAMNLLSVIGYYGYSLRFYFIGCFINFLGLLHTTSIIRLTDTEKTHAAGHIANYFMIFSIFIFIAIMAHFVVVLDLTTNNTTDLKLSLMFAIIMVALGVSLLLYFTPLTRGQVKKRTIKVMCIIVAIISIFSNFLFSFGAGFYKLNDYNEISSLILASGEKYKICDDQYTNCLLGTRAITTAEFTSFMENNSIVMNKNLGYITTTNSAHSRNSVLLSDMIAGYKYFIVPKEKDMSNRPYLIKQSETKNYILYINSLSLNSGLVLDEIPKDIPENLIDRLEWWYHLLGGSGNLLDEVAEIDLNKCALGTKLEINVSAGNILYVINEKEIQIVNELYLDSQSFSICNTDSIQDLGYYDSDSTVSMSLDKVERFVLSDKNDDPIIKICTLDISKLYDLYALQDHSVQIEVRDNKIDISCSEITGKYLCLPYAYNSNLITSTKLIENPTNMLLFNVDSDNITIGYGDSSIPKCLFIGLSVLIIGIVLLMLEVFTSIFDRLQNILHFGFLGIFVLLIVVYVSLPTAAAIVKPILSLFI